MALAIDSRDSHVFTGAGFGTPATYSGFTVNNASPLIVSVSTSVRSVASVTWDGAALTLCGSTSSAGAGSFYCSLWCLPNPATGNKNLVITLNVANDDFAVQIVSTSGGDTTTGFRTASIRQDGNGAGPGITLANSQNGDIVFNAANVLATTITFNAGETTTSTVNNNVNGNNFSVGLSSKAAVGANTSVGCTNTTFYSEVVMAVIAAAAAGGGPCNLMTMGVGKCAAPIAGLEWLRHRKNRIRRDGYKTRESGICVPEDYEEVA